MTTLTMIFVIVLSLGYNIYLKIKLNKKEKELSKTESAFKGLLQTYKSTNSHDLKLKQTQ